MPSRLFHRRPGPLVAAALLLVASTGSAQIPIRALAHAASPDESAMWTDRTEVSAIIEFPEGVVGPAWGLPIIGSHFSVVNGALADLGALARAHADWKMTWSPPLRPLLDHAVKWVEAPAFHDATGLTGKGVVVGIVDTGADCAHPDLRNADGSTRIAYLITFGEEPFHPAGAVVPDAVTRAEAQCQTAKLKCSVRSATDIDRELAIRSGAALPTDTIGHGTHVASIAAGNGGAEGKYVGIAPEASLVVVRALDSHGDLTDVNVLVGTGIVFSLADGMGPDGRGLPAVVNLSLGSDAGPHDGTSAPLERGLAELVGDDHPGRAIVVAVGNSAGLAATRSGPPDRLGVHTDVSIPERSRVLVPVVLRPSAGQTTELTAGIDVYVAFRPGDDVSVGVDRNGAEWIAPRGRGFSGTYGTTNTLAVSIVNGVADDPRERPPDAAFVIIRGTFSGEDQFALTFEGHGTASLWVQPEGDLADPSAGGVLLHGATREATVTLPATSPAVIAVGATLNRTEWVDRTGEVDHVDSLGSVKNPPLDSVAFFSSAGPTTDSRLKPDLVAPGGFVVAAMSRDADPKDNPLSIFADTACDPAADCAVVDATHAVSAGTSMAAPMVAGAVALLLEQDPTLTTERLRTLLQAGARRPEGAIPYTLTTSYSAQSGAGVLDLEGIRDVKDVPSAARKPPDPHTSWLTLGATYAHPDPGFPVPAVLKLKDASGRAALADRDSLELDVDRGRIVGTPDFAAPGLVRFSVAAESDTGGDTLRVVARNHEGEIASAELPIAVDVNVVREGFFGHGGCAVTLSERVNGESLPFFVALALVFRRTRRRSARRFTSRTT